MTLQDLAARVRQALDLAGLSEAQVQVEIDSWQEYVTVRTSRTNGDSVADLIVRLGTDVEIGGSYIRARLRDNQGMSVELTAPGKEPRRIEVGSLDAVWNILTYDSTGYCEVTVYGTQGVVIARASRETSGPLWRSGIWDLDGTKTICPIA